MLIFSPGPPRDQNVFCGPSRAHRGHRWTLRSSRSWFRFALHCSSTQRLKDSRQQFSCSAVSWTKELDSSSLQSSFHSGPKTQADSAGCHQPTEPSAISSLLCVERLLTENTLTHSLVKTKAQMSACNT
ncbi:unnamed protein product [Gadus morhua 'NCC']